MMSEEIERDAGCLIPMSSTIVAILSSLITLLAVAFLMPSVMDAFSLHIIGILTMQMIVIQMACAYAMRHMLAMVTVFRMREVEREVDVTSRGQKSKLRWYR